MLSSPIASLEAEEARLDHLLRFSSTEIAFTALEILDGPPAFLLRAIAYIWGFYQKRALTAVACDYATRAANYGTLDHFVVIRISPDNSVLYQQQCGYLELYKPVYFILSYPPLYHP